jgi:hypothetical protein
MGGGGVLQVKMHEFSKNPNFPKKYDFPQIYRKFLDFFS